MKFITALLPAAALANPLVSIRQAERAQFTDALRVDGRGCDGATLSLSNGGELAQVLLPSYRVAVGPGVPDSQRELPCSVFLTARYPLGCTRTRVSSTLTGAVNLTGGATATYQRAYVVSPGRNFSGTNPPTLEFRSPVPGPDYIQNDTPAFDEQINNANEQAVSFSLQGRLSMQRPTNAAAGNLDNGVWSVNLADQGPC